MSDTIGVPLAELKVSQIKDLLRTVRREGRANPLSAGLANEVAKPLVMWQRKLTVQRARLAIEYFLEFRRDVLKAKP